MMMSDGSAVQRVTACLEAIERFDSTLGVMITVTADEALKQAEEADKAAARGDWHGVLHGMPIALKDNIDTAGVRTTSGGAFDADRVPKTDATVTTRLKANGAIIIGKVNLAEYAFSVTTQNHHYGSCKNPWDISRIPGGSSGGSGAAVAANMAAGTLGTDTGGSVRIPASFNGLVGIRPTLGRVPNTGVTPVSEAFDTVGPLARRAVDVARMLHAIEGYDPTDLTSVDAPFDDVLGQLDRGVEGSRIGVATNLLAEATPDIAERVADGIRVLEAAGAEVFEMELHDTAEAQAHMMNILYPEASAKHEERINTSPEKYGPGVLERLQRGFKISSLDTARSLSYQREYRRRMARIFDEFDLLAMPTVPVAPPQIDGTDITETTHQLTILTYWTAMAQLPGVSIPCGFAAGLPVGLQLVGRPFADGELLAAAALYQTKTEFHLAEPPLVA
jgi:aspartyl-tRNA(Asn)/glutamyl-tRNA(Gln) amidotransferase subunit A